MPQAKKPKRQPKDQAQAARIRNLERALKEERAGLVAIATAFLKAGGDPQRLVHRLDSMVRGAVDDPKVKPGAKAAMLAGQRIIERAWAIHLEKPQPLWQPDVGPTDPGQVATIANQDQEQQMGLGLGNGDGRLADVEDAESERRRTVQRIHDAIVLVLTEHGALTDDELHFRYSTRSDFVLQSAGALRARRVELTRAGRVVSNGKKDGKPVWDLLERQTN